MVRIDDELKGSYILAADTVVAVGRRILPKPELLDEAAQCLRLLSGRNHRVHTAICLITPAEAFRQRLVETRVRFKRLSDEDVEAYLASGEWRGKAGGYAAQGIAGSFIVKIVGSYSNVWCRLRRARCAPGRGLSIRFSWSTRCDTRPASVMPVADCNRARTLHSITSRRLRHAHLFDQACSALMLRSAEGASRSMATRSAVPQRARAASAEPAAMLRDGRCAPSSA
jgi:hypothetical protein